MKKERSALLDLIDGYEIPKEHINARGDAMTGKTFFSRSYSGRIGNTGVLFPRLFAFIRGNVKRLVYTSFRTYGTMLLFFGVLVTVARSPYVESYVTVLLATEGVPPPFALNVTV